MPRNVLLTVLVGVICSAPLAAQIPDRFENLQVLPRDISRAELIGTMRSYATALGVRCVHCHAGEDRGGLEGVDFRSDERAAKRKARAMMRLVASINAQLSEVPDVRPGAQVSCITCHHGFVRPTTLADTLARVIRSSGPAAALAEYDTLRARYYGRDSFDFGFGSLNGLAERLYGERSHEAAIAIAHKNDSLYPGRWESQYELARNYEALGRTEAAIAAYRAVLARVPNHGVAAARLRALTGG